jgi:hypothetical protein
MKCADCKFWVLVSGSPVSDDIDPGVGECRRHAPAPTFDGPLMLARMLGEYGEINIEKGGDLDSWATRCVAWPITFDEAFCGDHVPTAEKRVGFV